MITWEQVDRMGTYSGNCLSKDFTSLPTDGIVVKNGSSVFIMDKPTGVVTSQFYKFDEENHVWLSQPQQ